MKDGYELISEALNLLNNVYGAMHPEIAQCLRMLARLNYIMGDHMEAMSCQQKAVLMSERVNGIDHPYTITEYTHLALYCFANTQVRMVDGIWEMDRLTVNQFTIKDLFICTQL